MVDVAIRLGINEFTIPGWEARFKLMAKIEAEIGCSIYSILPGIIEGTFGEELASNI
jgi:hypothetical protein